MKKNTFFIMKSYSSYLSIKSFSRPKIVLTFSILVLTGLETALGNYRSRRYAKELSVQVLIGASMSEPHIAS